MKDVRQTGYLLIGGFIFLLLGMLVPPADAYQGELAARLQVIDMNQGRWYLSKVFDAFGAALPGLGFFLLLQRRAERQNRPALARLTGWLLLLSAALGAFYAYRLAVTPGTLWAAGFPEPLSFTFMLSYTTGFLLFVFAISEHIAPPWVFFVAAPAALVAWLAVLFLRGYSPFYVFAPLSLVNLLLGMVLARSNKAAD